VSLGERRVSNPRSVQAQGLNTDWRLTSKQIQGGADASPISRRPRRVSVKKTLVYRLVVDPVALLVTYVSTGEVFGSILAVAITETFSTIFYYVLDRLM